MRKKMLAAESPLLFGCGILCAFVVLCGSSSAQQKITYEQNVLPLLRDKCLTCHNSDKAKGGLDASTYSKLMEGGSSGEVVKAGDAEGSRLFLLASHKEEPKMPPNSPPMAKESLDVIKAWIAAGAPENAGSKLAAPVKKVETALKTSLRTKPTIAPMPEKALPTQTLRTPRANAVTALAASPWAPLAALAAPKQVLLYNTDTLELVGVLPYSHGQINVLKFSRSGELLLAAGGRGGKAGKVVLYSIKTGEIVTELADETDAITAADLSPDQSEVAVGGPGRVVHVYSVGDGSKLRDFKKHTEWITAIEYSPDGVLLATADRNGGLALWEVATGQEYQVLAGHRLAVTDLAWRDDANVLVSASEEGNIKYWSVEDGKQIRAVGLPGPLAARFAHDGRVFTTGRDLKTRMLDGNGAPQREFVGAADLTTKVAITHDGARVLTGDWIGAVHVWQTADGAKVGQLSTNPPTPAERLEIAKAEFAAKQKAVELLQAQYNAAVAENQTVQAANSIALTAFQTAEQALAAAKTANDVAQKNAAALAGLAVIKKSEVEAAGVKLTAFTVAYNHLQAESAKVKENAALAKAAQDGKALADVCEKALKEAQAAVVKVAADQKAARQEVEKAAKALPPIEAAWKASKADFEAKNAAAKPVAAKAVAAKAVLDRTIAERDAAKSLIDRLTPKS
jgi:Planctomycete cytochrome C/WD domain, G-beta repeat